MQVIFTYTRTGKTVHLKNVGSWADETSPYDPYTLRVIRDKNKNVIAAPMASECLKWVELPDVEVKDC